MVIIKLQGGLGNQMFQYALGRNISLKKKLKVKFDLSFYNKKIEGVTPRDYALNYFNIKADIANYNEARKLKKYEFKKGRKYFFHNLFVANGLIYIKEKQSTILNINNIKLVNRVYLDGYWQNEKYFKDIEQNIKNEFTLKNKLSYKAQDFLKKIKNIQSISIHIRRGDYAKNVKTNLHHGLCPLNYYKEAINIMANKTDSPTFFVFSDDIEWVKKNLKIKYPLFFISGHGLNDAEELILMSKCKHNIIANSSFSWWSAWLNNNPNKVIIAPKKWFNNPEKNNYYKLPKKWTRI